MKQLPITQDFIELSPDGILLTSGDGLIAHCNASACSMFQYPQLCGRSLYTLIPRLKEWKSAPDIIPCEGKRRDGSRFYMDAAIRELDGGCFLIFLHDTTEYHREHERLLQLSTHDSLTGLYNRAAILRLARKKLRELSVSRAPESELCFAVLDLDRFKHYNDTYGHAVGDRVLLHMARAFDQNLPNFLCGRLGGEEFLLLSQHTLGQTTDGLIRLRAFCQKETYPTPERVTFSAGVFSVLSSGAALYDEERLTAFADQLMYEAKRYGRNKICCQKQGHDFYFV